MPSAAIAVAQLSTPRRAATCHLFGAVGTQAEIIARQEDGLRARAEAEASRLSGNSYVDRMMGTLRTR